MSRRITTEEYRQQVKQLNNDFEVLGEYINNKTPILHRCSNGHDWVVVSTQIKAGAVCPECNTYKNKKITNTDYQIMLVNLNNGIVCLEEYKNIKTKLNHQCSEGHQWMVVPESILKGHGCPFCCTNHKLSTAEYREQLTEMGLSIKCTDEYQGDKTKIKHQCSNGHQWNVRPADIKQGNGCPSCSILRTNRDIYENKPTWLYYIYIRSLDVYKVGVTMEANPGCKARYRGSKIENSYDVLAEVLYPDGYEALQLEQHIINTNQNKKWNYQAYQAFGGQTECFYEDIKPNLDDLSQIPNILS